MAPGVVTEMLTLSGTGRDGSALASGEVHYSSGEYVLLTLLTLQLLNYSLFRCFEFLLVHFDALIFY